MMLNRISQEATDTMGLLYRAQLREEKTKEKKVEMKISFLKEEEKGKRKKEKKIIVMDSSSEEDSFFEFESESESVKTPPAKRTRQQEAGEKTKDCSGGFENNK
ncbi:hypothetical protein AHAS_Ahas01G0318800 [Arachis hypogaea]